MTPAAGDAMAVVAALVLEDGKRWAEVATDWQVADAQAILSPGDGPRLCFLTRPRGASKTTDLAAVALAWLTEQAPPGAQAIAAAGDRDQAALLVRELGGFVARSPRSLTRGSCRRCRRRRAVEWR